MVSLAFERSHEWAEGIPPSGNELRCGIGGIFLTVLPSDTASASGSLVCAAAAMQAERKSVVCRP
jgi:hypothetical protein